MKTPWTNELSRVVFLELRRDIQIGEIKLPKGFALPVLYDELERKVLARQSGDFTNSEVLRGILLLYALDEDFPDREIYSSIVHQLQLPTQNLLPFFVEISQSDQKLAFLLSLGYYHLGLADPITMLFTAESADNLFRENSEEKIGDIAFNLYREIHQISPSWQSNYHLAYHYYNRDRYEDALQHISACYDELPSDELRTEITQLFMLSEQKSVFHEGKKLLFKERYDEALIKFHSLHEEFPGWYDLHFFTGLSYRMLQQFSRALVFFYRALSLKRDDPQLYNEMAICHLMLNEPLEAEPLLEAALQLDRDNPELLCNRAIVYIRTDRLHEAREDLLRARKLDPSDELYFEWLNYLSGLEEQSEILN
ncbi:MAG: tetratricopeptide repeat protein [Bacillota bacterium]|nr:tetratricopeptide repeat protein [Bacillota bacterium]